MPSRMTHYCIGNEILKILSLNRGLFTVGNLSPDAHDGSFDGVGASHYKTSYRPGIDKYPVADLGAFKAKYLAKVYDSFVLGYYCHLITDNLWTEAVYYEYLQCNEVERNIRVEKCYQDYFTLNSILIGQYGLNKLILQIHERIHIKEITLVNVKRIVNEFYNDFNRISKKYALMILTEQFVKNFITNAVEKCLQEIDSTMRREHYIP